MIILQRSNPMQKDIFPKVYFPDFTEEAFEEALSVYQNRNRRFGGIVYENKNY